MMALIASAFPCVRVVPAAHHSPCSKHGLCSNTMALIASRVVPAAHLRTPRAPSHHGVVHARPVERHERVLQGALQLQSSLWGIPTAAASTLLTAAIPMENPCCSCMPTDQPSPNQPAVHGLTAAIPVESPCCSCMLTRVRPALPSPRLSCGFRGRTTSRWRSGSETTTPGEKCSCRSLNAIEISTVCSQLLPSPARFYTHGRSMTYSCNPYGESLLQLYANTCSSRAHPEQPGDRDPPPGRVQRPGASHQRDET